MRTVVTCPRLEVFAAPSWDPAVPTTSSQPKCKLYASPWAPGCPLSHLHQDELGAQGCHVRELLPEAQHHPAVWQAALAAIELLQLWGDTEGGSEGGLQAVGCGQPAWGRQRAGVRKAVHTPALCSWPPQSQALAQEI